MGEFTGKNEVLLKPRDLLDSTERLIRAIWLSYLG